MGAMVVGCFSGTSCFGFLGSKEKVGYDSQTAAKIQKTGAKNKDGAVELYDKWASTYDDNLKSWGYVTPERIAEYLSNYAGLFGVSKSFKLLDAGCGTGLSGDALLKQGFSNMVGIDVSPESLKLTEEKKLYAHLEECNLEEKLPFKTDEFGFVTCVGVLSYIHNFPVLFGEWCRVTKRDGLIVTQIREDLWETNFEGVKSTAEDLEKRGLWKQVLLSEPSYSMPDKPTSEPMKKIRYWVFQVTKP